MPYICIKYRETEFECPLILGLICPHFMQIHVKIAAFFGFLGVSAGAFGAHALKDTLKLSDMTHVWETAVLYTLIHATAMLSVGLCGLTSDLWLKRACLCWTAGVLLFAGSLYGLALTNARFLGPITPVGGLFLLAGWVCVFLAVLRPKPL